MMQVGHHTYLVIVLLVVGALQLGPFCSLNRCTLYSPLKLRHHFVADLVKRDR